MHTRCPKCGHAPLPADQALPAACPACGVILAKVGELPAARPAGRAATTTAGRRIDEDEHESWLDLLTQVPDEVDRATFWLRALLLAALAVWGCVLIAQDYRNGEIANAFLHRPLLIFHEAGHVIFSIFGEWATMAGGTLGQLLMPLILMGALLITNRDPYGASVGLWFFGVSLLDVAPYMYDALQPQLMLLSGKTGEDGGHDWIFLFTTTGLLAKSQFIGALTHKLGALVIALSVAWGVWLLLRMRGRIRP